jgi:hypothetical protein
MQIIEKNDQDILNYCARYLARGNKYIDSPPAPENPNLSRASEAWRFPIIQSYGPPGSAQDIDYTLNEVTFIYQAKEEANVQQVAVVGTFAKLYETTPLKPVQFLGEPTGYFALTVVLPVEHTYRYRFVVDGQSILDPINPQQVVLPNGKRWSRFFTDFNLDPVAFEHWELRLLYRLTEHILPFETQDAETFLDQFYNQLSADQKRNMHVFEMDVSVGEVNYIDNILAREENHHLIDYKICLEQIDRVLRQRNSYVESWEVSKQLIVELYEDMANNSVNGWDYTKYNSPRYFLELLRRHAIIGAFCHPKYGGNAGGIGWAYLTERYVNPQDQTTLFDWQAAQEKPLGTNEDYIG